LGKLEARLRKVCQRTLEDLWEFLGQAVDVFSPAEGENYFWRCGYDTS
jgi:hypothetical protein